MPIHSREQIAGEIALPHNPPANPDDDHSVSVPREQMEVYTLEVTRLLFKEKGPLLLATLLQQTQTKQRPLPSNSLIDRVVITTKTIHKLATRISQPYLLSLHHSTIHTTFTAYASVLSGRRNS